MDQRKRRNVTAWTLFRCHLLRSVDSVTTKSRLLLSTECHQNRTNKKKNCNTHMMDPNRSLPVWRYWSLTSGLITTNTERSIVVDRYVRWLRWIRLWWLWKDHFVSGQEVSLFTFLSWHLSTKLKISLCMKTSGNLWIVYLTCKFELLKFCNCLSLEPLYFWMARIYKFLFALFWNFFVCLYM